jgi:hypothetical protein
MPACRYVSSYYKALVGFENSDFCGTREATSHCYVARPKKECLILPSTSTGRCKQNIKLRPLALGKETSPRDECS